MIISVVRIVVRNIVQLKMVVVTSTSIISPKVPMEMRPEKTLAFFVMFVI